MPQILIEKALQHGVPPQGPAQVYALSIWKTLVAPYLARSFSVDARTSAFLHTYSELAHRLAPSTLKALAADDHLLWRDGDHLITVKMEHVITNEGEMTLHYRIGEHPLYGLSFSLVPGHVVALSAPTVLLLTRMQGRSTAEANAFREKGEGLNLSPQVALYSALLGVARDLHLPLVGIAASNQMCWTPERDAAFQRVYDDFYRTVDGSPLSELFFWLPTNPVRRSLSEIGISHRRRTRRRREARDALSLAAAASWSELTTGLLRKV